MSDSEHDVLDDSVKTAFEGYRADPGGDVRIDAAEIAGAGRHRVRRHQIAAGAGGLAVLIAAAVVVPNLAGGGDDPDRSAPIAAAGALPSTGRDPGALFSQAWGAQGTSVKPGDGDLGQVLASKLDPQPAYLDAGWQPGPNRDGKGTRWAVLTWVKGDKAAEGMLVAADSPIYRASFPPPYRVCEPADTAGGAACSARLVDGKGWLKVQTSAGKNPELTVSLQRIGDAGLGRLYGFRAAGGAVTGAPLAGGRSPLGSIPVGEKEAADALLALP